jgi:hypothetical protein
MRPDEARVGAGAGGVVGARFGMVGARFGAGGLVRTAGARFGMVGARSA